GTCRSTRWIRFSLTCGANWSTSSRYTRNWKAASPRWRVGAARTSPVKRSSTAAAPISNARKRRTRLVRRERNRFYRAGLRAFYAGVDAIIRPGHDGLGVVLIPVKHRLRADFKAFFVTDAGV